MTKNKLEAVIFDMDGVIADTMKYHYLANKRIANELGLSFTESDNDKFKGISRMDIIKSFVHQANLNLSEEELLELSDRKNSYYKEYLNSLSPEDVLDGILPFLKELKADGIKTAIASSSTNAFSVLKMLEVYDYFDYIVDAKTVKKGKPHPEVFLKAADSINVNYENCIAIEDGEAGLRAILSTPMFSVGVGEDIFMPNAHLHLSSTNKLSLSLLKEKFDERGEYVIGIDGGGTYTRAILTDLSGNVLSSVKIDGGAHPGKNPNAKGNVQKTILNAVQKANVKLSDVKSIAGGIAGINKPEDVEWAKELIIMDGLHVQSIFVNDAVIAKIGAVGKKPGIIAIAGTGSIIAGFKADGSIIRNYDFNHLAYAGARYLSYDAVYEIVAGNVEVLDKEFVTKALEYWNVDSVSGLKNILLGSHDAELISKLGLMCPLVTSFAESGSPIAIRVSDKVAYNLSIGIKLVAADFEDEHITISTIGGVSNDSYIQNKLVSYLNSSSNKKFEVVPPLHEPVYGAALLALDIYQRR